MKLSMTGIGGLSRKVFAVTVIGIYSQLVGAQTASTGPNKVYIEQIGSTNTVTIEQVGGTNNVGGVGSTTPSASNYATINGSTNAVTITQAGDSNLNQYNIKGNNNIFTSTITGIGNSSKLVMGSQNTNTLRSTVTETVTGNNNTTDQTVIGNDITSTLSITGSTNQVTTNLSSTNGVSNVEITGSNNKLDIEQRDVAGSNGHNLQQYVSGDYNSIVTQQQGSNDTSVDIRTTGSHNTVTVRTSSSTIIGPQTAVAR